MLLVLGSVALSHLCIAHILLINAHLPHPSCCFPQVRRTMIGYVPSHTLRPTYSSSVFQSCLPPHSRMSKKRYDNVLVYDVMHVYRSVCVVHVHVVSGRGSDSYIITSAMKCVIFLMAHTLLYYPRVN